jgi:hypothetical protein
MDDAAKTVFKRKFITLVVLLNLDVLFFFLAAILYFLLREYVPFGIAIFFLILALVLGYYVARNYRETREWLNENA